MIELCYENLSVRCIWLYVLIMSRTRFRVNPHSMVALMPRNSLLETGAKSEAFNRFPWILMNIPHVPCITGIPFPLSCSPSVINSWYLMKDLSNALNCTQHLPQLEYLEKNEMPDNTLSPNSTTTLKPQKWLFDIDCSSCQQRKIHVDKILNKLRY